MKLYKKALLLGLILIMQYSYGQDWKNYPFSPSGSLVKFPKDEGSHPQEPVEWWYAMGHLKGETTGKDYSFMLSYFHYPYSGFDGFRILNISNDNTGQFYSETLPVKFTILSPDSLNIIASVFTRSIDTWTNKKDSKGKSIPFEYTIQASSTNRALKLEYISRKSPLILADSGFFYQGASSYTYYYSQTNNSVTGTITLEGLTENVTGSCWIDRQYGSFNPLNKEKYEWFCIQLSNGMDINVFNIFTAKNLNPETIKYKTMGVHQNDGLQYTTADFKVERLNYAYTPDSSSCYSQKWRLTSPVNDIDITFTTLHSTYEVKLPFRFYEGPTSVTGKVNGKDVTGKGFAELLKSYEKPIVEFSTFNIEDDQIQWKLKNPDDGRLIKYTLEYTTDGDNYLPIAIAITDTFAIFNQKPAGSYKLKLSAYSLDSTLKSSTSMVVDPTISSLSGKNVANGKWKVQSFGNTITCTHPSNAEATKLTIIDVNGNEIFAPSVTKNYETIVDITNLKTGIYHFTGQNSNYIWKFKFVKE